MRKTNSKRLKGGISEMRKTSIVMIALLMATIFAVPFTLADEDYAPEDLNQDTFVDGDDLGILRALWGPCNGCSADINEDGFVNTADLLLLIAAWNPRPTADLNLDGVVDVLDLQILLASWGPCPGCNADLNGDDVVNGADLKIWRWQWMQQNAEGQEARAQPVVKVKGTVKQVQSDSLDKNNFKVHTGTKKVFSDKAIVSYPSK